MKIPQSTFVSKSLYKIGGLLSRIKVPTRIYAYDLENRALSEKSRWTWCSVSLSLKVGLVWAERFDVKHWEHWALDHSGCGGVYCSGCRGQICGRGDTF